jgi:hypothetical protein
MKKLSTKEKSVRINIESEYYGTIAEIGGGQETARHLFQAGGASNTVAKSISAYDKLFSDHFYNQGEPSRYVSEDRLHKMLCSEYEELIKILDLKNSKKFFAFANTVETINYSKTNSGKGWLGIAIEGTDRYNPNLMFIHVKLRERDTLLQQYTLGTLGINLIYGGLFFWEDPRKILLGMLDNLDSDRVEIDYAFVNGPDLTWVDNRLLNLMLVSHSMTPAVIFDNKGRIKHSADMLYRKNVLLMRGYFRPINKLGVEFIENSLEIFKRDEAYSDENTLVVCEISINYLMEGEQVNEIDFLHRVDLLNLTGQHVMISKFKRYFELSQYFKQYKLIKLRMVLGLPTFEKILDSSFYSDLKGGILEALGDLFQDNVKVYLYPKIDTETGELIYPDDTYFKGKKRLLWQYLCESQRIVLLKTLSNKNLMIHSEKVRTMLESADEELIEFLPAKVLEHIKSLKLFQYGSQS